MHVHAARSVGHEHKDLHMSFGWNYSRKPTTELESDLISSSSFRESALSKESKLGTFSAPSHIPLLTSSLPIDPVKNGVAFGGVIQTQPV